MGKKLIYAVAVPKNSKQFLRRIIMDLMYTAVYEQDHFSLGTPEGFTTENWPIRPEYKKTFDHYNLEGGYAFQQQYNSAHFPRMIIVTFQHLPP